MAALIWVNPKVAESSPSQSALGTGAAASNWRAAHVVVEVALRELTGREHGSHHH